MLRTITVLPGVLSLVLGLSAPAWAQSTHVVEGTEKNGVNVWKYKKSFSNDKSKLGNADNRLRIPVKNGDSVKFMVSGDRKHGVVFERAADELSKTIWSVGAGPLQLMDIDSSFQDFEMAEAKTTAATDGDILTIKVENLKTGDENGILFGCNPHSKKPSDGSPRLKRMMLAVIVLDD